MKVSVITVCYNSEKTIEATIQSVIVQTGVELEYIIIDGGSVDTTLDIIARYKGNIDVLVSEKDAGIYDAMNKGIQKATGEIIAILNSDDHYTGPGVLKKVADSFTMDRIDACYGDIDYVEEVGSKVVRRWKAGEYAPHKLASGWTAPHPAFFVKKALYERFGGFNATFTIAADYEFMLRLFLAGINVGYIPEPLVTMKSGGKSAASLAQRIKGWRELRRAWKVNNKHTPSFFLTRRIVSKVHQYFV